MILANFMGSHPQLSHESLMFLPQLFPPTVLLPKCAWAHALGHPGCELLQDI